MEGRAVFKYEARTGLEGLPAQAVSH
jgi:hypothetical protein